MVHPLSAAPARPPAPPAVAAPRIALFTGAYDHIRDGVALTLNRLVAYLERQGVAVRVFAPTAERPALQHAGTRIPVRSLPAPGRPEYRVSLGLPRAARRELAAFAPTLVHVATPDLLGVQALRQARAAGLPMVATYHTHFASYLEYYRLGALEGVLWRYLRWFYGACAHVYVPTPTMLEVLRAHGVRSDLRLWPRGVETQLFTPARRSEAWRRSVGAADDEPVVLFVSRVVAEKGLDVLAAVLRALEARGVRHRSVVVGDGPERAALAAQLPNTRFLGQQQGEALATAYASSDVFLFPSRTETFGNVTLEAMASGLAAVCADAPGSGSLVRPGATGFLAPPHDATVFLEHVERLVTDAPLRARFGAQAREVALGYDWERVLATILAYYHEVPGATPGRPAPAGAPARR